MNAVYIYLGIGIFVLAGIAIVAFVKAVASSAGERIGKKRKKEKMQLRAVSIHERRLIHPNGEEEVFRHVEERFAEIPDEIDAQPVLETVKLLN